MFQPKIISEYVDIFNVFDLCCLFHLCYLLFNFEFANSLCRNIKIYTILWKFHAATLTHIIKYSIFKSEAKKERKKKKTKTKCFVI